MKTKLVLLLLLVTVSISPAVAPPPATGRTLKDLHGFPLTTARRMLPHQLCRSLEVSPVESWVIARSRIYSGKPAATKIIHEEAAGAYDKMTIELAESYRTSGNDATESRIAADTLTFHLVVFKIADGKLAILIPHNDDDRYAGYAQAADTWIGIYKNGQWTRVNRPQHG
jgi:hypothetical protein